MFSYSMVGANNVTKSKRFYYCPEQVNAWHNAGIDNGGTTCENPPSIRDNGNKLCAAYFMSHILS